jgi:DNA invertase Pin-like site-specific DNA recombinase
MPKQFRAPQETNLPISYDTSLPTSLPIAIYYRQSTDAQIGNISTTLQTVDMVRFLKQQGWSDEHIIMIDMDGGVSGTTKIDERSGMRWLFSLITENKIGAVACQDIDRLFRDVTQIQVNVFIEACRAHNVRVITPTMMYDFTHEQLGTFHARQFRFQSEMAADYISTVVKGKLLRAKQSLVMNGQWAGGSIPVGYMIDVRKTLPDGSRNEHYKKYAVFEPYAMVVREYFRLYRMFSGNQTKTLFHIQKHGPYYPDPATCPPPEGFKVCYSIKQNAFGWCPKAKQSLIETFVNPAYIGHWVVSDVVIRWYNHPPMLDEETFYYAFNRHSSFNLDGGKNTLHKDLRFNERPSVEVERTEDRPLLTGLVFSLLDGNDKQVGTRWSNDSGGRYFYTLTRNDGLGTPIWAKRAEYFDASVVDLLLSKLRLTFDYAVWEKEVDASIQEVEVDLRLKQAQLSKLETVMENLVTSLSSLTTPQLIAAIEQKYKDAQIEHDRLSKEMEVMTSRIASIESFKAIKESYENAMTDWEGLSRDTQREVIHAFVEKVQANKIPGFGHLNLTIHWRDGSSSRMEMLRASTSKNVWLPQHVAKLVKMVESGKGQLEIAKEFPERQWSQIYRKYHFLTHKPLDLTEDHPIGKYESYNEYLERIGSQSMTSGVDSPCP